MHKRPYTYQHCVPQPISVPFCFAAHEGSQTDGLVQFRLNVGDFKGGPYLTVLRTTREIWDNRKSVKPTNEGRLLAEQTATLSKRIIDAWKTFNQKGQPITPDMVLNRAGFKVFSVAAGGALYVI